VATGTTEYLTAAAVIGIYIITAIEHTGPAVPVTVLIYSLAVITWCVLGDGPGAVCGVLRVRRRGVGAR
jgi:hypothetical protein